MSDAVSIDSSFEENKEEARRLPLLALPLVLILALLAMVFIPPVSGNPRLIGAFCGAAGGLSIWLAALFLRTRATGRRLEMVFVPVKAHYIQASLHFSIYCYWGYYWRNVYAEAPLILAQVLFLYALDMLLCWSRRDTWRLGFGCIPIIFSTNLFLWFKDDWFFLQFLMVATGALGKEFIRWQREGKLTHIFNPSGFSLSVFSLGVILTGTTHITWGVEIATTMYRAQHMYLWIFAVGLIVQYLFSVTLMTLSAAAVLALLNVIYTKTTGVYYFVDTNIPVAVFLGLHLLMTDPSTSPRSNIGRILFGAAYGLAVFALYELLEYAGIAEFYDKLLPVPLLNLSVQGIERLAKSGFMLKLEGWSRSLGQRSNLAHMGVWVALFGVMFGTGFVEGRHPGLTIEFWKQAAAQGRRKAAENLVRTLDFYANAGSAEAANELGVLFMEGKYATRSPAAAAAQFARATRQGNVEAAYNLASLGLSSQAGNAGDLARALDTLEAASAQDTDGRLAYSVGLAHFTGNGRPLDKPKALEFFRKASALGWVDGSKQVAKMRMLGDGVPVDATEAATALEKASAAGDAKSSYFLALLLHEGKGRAKDDARAMQLLEKAKAAGSRDAASLLGTLHK